MLKKVGILEQNPQLLSMSIPKSETLLVPSISVKGHHMIRNRTIFISISLDPNRQEVLQERQKDLPSHHIIGFSKPPWWLWGPRRCWGYSMCSKATTPLRLRRKRPAFLTSWRLIRFCGSGDEAGPPLPLRRPGALSDAFYLT